MRKDGCCACALATTLAPPFGTQPRGQSTHNHNAEWCSACSGKGMVACVRGRPCTAPVLSLKDMGRVLCTRARGTPSARMKQAERALAAKATHGRHMLHFPIAAHAAPTRGGRARRHGASLCGVAAVHSTCLTAAERRKKVLCTHAQRPNTRAWWQARPCGVGGCAQHLLHRRGAGAVHTRTLNAHAQRRVHTPSVESPHPKRRKLGLTCRVPKVLKVGLAVGGPPLPAPTILTATLETREVPISALTCGIPKVLQVGFAVCELLVAARTALGRISLLLALGRARALLRSVRGVGRSGVGLRAGRGTAKRYAMWAGGGYQFQQAEMQGRRASAEGITPWGAPRRPRCPQASSPGSAPARCRRGRPTGAAAARRAWPRMPWQCRRWSRGCRGWSPGRRP